MKELAMAAALVVALSVPTLAGEVPTGGKSEPPPPPPTTQSSITTTVILMIVSLTR